MEEDKLVAIARKFGMTDDLTLEVYVFMEDAMEEEHYDMSVLLAQDAARTYPDVTNQKFFDELADLYFLENET